MRSEFLFVACILLTLAGPVLATHDLGGEDNQADHDQAPQHIGAEPPPMRVIPANEPEGLHFPGV